MRVDASLWAMVAATCLLAAGCDAGTDAKGARSRQAVQDADTAEAFRIIGTDAGFEAPDRLAAGLRHVVFENRGSQIHEAMLIKLPGGMSATDYLAAVQGGSAFPEGALDYSGPGLTSPGEVVELWLRVDPGEYILLCWMNEHAVHRFTVQDRNDPDDVPPQEDVVLRMLDYRFELEGRLVEGIQAIRVETPGPSMHEVDFFRLHEGKTVADLRRWWKEKRKGPAPGDAMGGVLDSHDLRRVVWLRKRFTPGRYVLHCSMPMSMASNAATSATHADAGMVREFQIEE